MALVKLPAAAKALGVPYDALWRACRARVIPTIRFRDRGSYHVEQATISNYIRGHRVPSLRLALRIAAEANVPVESLLTDRPDDDVA